MSFNERYAKEEKKTFTPPEGVQAAARKALKWIEEGKAGDGFTGVGRGRAHQLANGEAVSLSTIKRMHSFFSRHRVDKQGKDWNKPSAGKVAWYAWGGDAGASWAAGIAGKNDGKKKEASLADMAHNVVTHLPTVIPAVAAEAAAVTGLVKTIKKNRNKPAPATGSDEAYNATGFMSPSQVQNYKNKDAVEKNSSFDERYANEKIANQYIKKQGDSWVITQKGTGKVLSHHDSEEKANAAFAAMMANKHGSVEHTCDVGDHKVHEDVRCVTPDCEHRGKSWESDGHQDWDHDYACGEHFTEGTTAGIAKNHDDDSDWRNRYSDLDSDW